jgi:hypothetical protein
VSRFRSSHHSAALSFANFGKRGTTRTNAATVKTVAGNLGAVAARIRGQVDHFLQALCAA